MPSIFGSKSGKVSLSSVKKANRIYRIGKSSETGQFVPVRADEGITVSIKNGLMVERVTISKDQINSAYRTARIYAKKL